VLFIVKQIDFGTVYSQSEILFLATNVFETFWCKRFATSIIAYYFIR